MINRSLLGIYKNATEKNNAYFWKDEEDRLVVNYSLGGSAGFDSVQEAQESFKHNGYTAIYESPRLIDESHEFHDAVWHAWKTDEFMAPPEKHHSELKGKDKTEFEQHVHDVKSHAKKHGISDPRKAVVHYTDKLAAEQMKKYKKEDVDIEEARSATRFGGVHKQLVRAVDDIERRQNMAKRALEQSKLHQAKREHDQKVADLNKKITDSKVQKEGADNVVRTHIAKDMEDYDQLEPPGSEARKARAAKISKALKSKTFDSHRAYVKAINHIHRLAMDIKSKREKEQE